MVEADFLIVGQGLAGTWLDYFLSLSGKRCIVIDRKNPNSASNISSGIVNPITGRKLVKTWMFDEMYNFAQSAYQKIEQKFNIKVWYNRNIVWLLQNEQDLNNFSARSSADGYHQHILAVERGIWKPEFKSAVGYAVVAGNYINTSLLLQSYRTHLLQNNRLIEDFVDIKDLTFLSEGVIWKNVKASKIIFCEGYLAGQNPFFNHLPLAPNKGEVLVVEAGELKITDHLIKGSAFLVPLGNDLFWAGSQYNFDQPDENISEEGRIEIENALKSMLTVPFKVVDHWAGIRPSTLQRRPLVGMHHKYPQIGILNGLGTKGVLMSTYFANKLSELLINNSTLPKDLMAI